MDERIIEQATIARNPLVVEIESRLSDLQFQRANQAVTRGPEHPEVRQLEEQIEQAERDLRTTMQTVMQSQVETTNPLHLSLATSLAAAEAETRAAAGREAALSSVLARERQRLAEIPGLETELAALERDSSAAEQMYSVLLERRQEFAIQEEMTPPVVEVIAAAEEPRSPVRPRKSLNLAIGLVLGLILAALAVGVAESLDDALRTSWQAQELLDLPSLAAVPKARAGSELLISQSASTATVDAYSALRTNLRFAAPGGMPRVIMVAGARAGSGASTVAANLATVLARGGQRVLAVDANLRGGDLPQKLGAQAGGGLSDVLAGAGRPGDCVVQSQERNLWVMPSGSHAPSPVDLLDSVEMKQTVESLAGQYDVIVIDSPSPDQHADPIVLAPNCDAALLVVEIGKTPLRVAQGVIWKLERAGKRPLGFIANGIRPG
ncbi:MAG: AAA family ATPase [Armatimonadia bacterium]|nr:AAA family ATPase [Armatimonadia bacterium]